jgi:hypothetical protein
MNEAVNGVLTWLAQSIAAGVAAGAAVIMAGGDVTSKVTWVAAGTAAFGAGWAHLRESPLPSKSGGAK